MQPGEVAVHASHEPVLVSWIDGAYECINCQTCDCHYPQSASEPCPRAEWRAVASTPVQVIAQYVMEECVHATCLVDLEPPYVCGRGCDIFEERQ